MGLAALAVACAPELVVGEWECPPPPDYDPAAEGEALEVPWSTGFERGFCDYTRTGGFCYASADATYDVVDSPTHEGRHAARFSVSTDGAANGTRCVRQGVLPLEATYGAWFYLPALAETTGNWNLFHFQGGAPDAWHGLWDVSLSTASDGSLYLGLWDDLNEAVRAPAQPVAVPIGSWFHVEFRLLRAKDAAGVVALYQDGTLLLEATSLVTDDTDVAQWYVGNLAEALTPAQSTLYVDEVSVRAGR